MIKIGINIREESGQVNSLWHVQCAGAPNDRFLSNAFRRCFTLSGVLLKLYRLILGCAKKYLSVRIF